MDTEKKNIDYHCIVQFTHILTSSLFTLTSYLISAGVAELADAPDLGSGGTPVQVQVLSPAPYKNRVTSVTLFLFYENDIRT